MDVVRKKRRSGRDEFEDQVARLAQLMKDASHTVFVTGAGISTNSGIPDYRGPDGIWTNAAKERALGADEHPWSTDLCRTHTLAKPTLTHRAVAALAREVEGRRFVQHVITQNEDGLHRRSGLEADKLSELHGNAFIELCGKYSEGDSDSDLDGSSSSSSDDDDDAVLMAKKLALKEKRKKTLAVRKVQDAAARVLRPAGCGAAVARDFVTYHGDTWNRTNARGPHVTGRRCPHCHSEASSEAQPTAEPCAGPGWLLDSTVDFGEAPSGFPWGNNAVHRVEAAKDHMRRADLVVVWGSTLSVLANYFDPWHPHSKWARAPLRLSRKKCKLVIVNKGKACDDELALIRIEADVDAVSAKLLELLGLPPPPAYDVTEDPFLKTVRQPFAGEPAAPWRIPGG
ncbi:DHS-like NAD/FAD-binding domain-containing protein [Pelagophyceae sp. CCMP2097]|nr:DHS-like NAD/FAD-binding domain-containing protein [Pelagophyceae sp. CCMP2097]